jgi:RNA polymerase sigma factor (sigma-70 family)
VSDACPACQPLETVRQHSICTACGTATVVLRPGPQEPAGTALRLAGPVSRHYTILEEVGSGTFATVYRARRKSDQAVVAMKFLRNRAGHDACSRFLREGDVMRGLTSPHVVRLLDVLELDGITCLVSEYQDGGNLRRSLARRRLPVDAALALAAQIVAGVAACHSAGILHRDLKPENILLTRAGVVRIADFGLARMQDDDRRFTATGTVMGTPAYMSPEQLRGEDVTAAGDLYALGVILHELLTGQLPHSAPTLAGLLAAKEGGLPQLAVHRQVPERQLLGLARLLAPDPEARPHSARDLPHLLGLPPLEGGRLGALAEAEAPDEQLAVAARQGRMEAFETLVRRHRDRIWRLAYGFTGDMAEAEDIAQETFLRFFVHLREYQQTGRLLSYLHRIVSRLCQDRAEKKRPRVSADLAELPFTGSSAGTKLDRRQRAAALRQALGELPSQQRMALLLKYFEHLSSTEIATVLNVTYKAVERHLAKGRRNLAALMEAGWSA